jgi:hypothetical protein
MSQQQGALHPAATDPERLQADCDVTRMRRSGPGGQNRNKVETAIVLRHRPTGLVAEANERRSQHENLQVALARLRMTLAVEVRGTVDPEAPPSAIWSKYVRNERITISTSNPDFPVLIAEALDTLQGLALDLGRAARRLGCTASQLTKLLKDEPRAYASINRARQAAGKRALM